MSRVYGIFNPKFYSPKNVLGTISLVAICKSIYAYTTYKEKSIKVKQKLITQHEGSSRFIIVDDDNNIYKVGFSLWYLQFKYFEIWNSLQENQTYKISSYGIRIPFIEYSNIICPNIINVKQQK